MFGTEAPSGTESRQAAGLPYKVGEVGGGLQGQQVFGTVWDRVHPWLQTPLLQAIAVTALW